MKLRINGFENEIRLIQNHANVIQIRNPKLLSHFIEVLNEKINDIDNNEIVLLDENNQELNFSKKVYLLIDVFNIDFNSKKILNKIYDLISNNIDVEQGNFINSINNNIKKKLINEINELPFSFNLKDSIDSYDLLKMYNVRIDIFSYTNPLNKIELLIEILSILKIADILIIPNLKSYLSEEELLELYKYGMYNNINIILLESRRWKKINYEKIIYIDEEFDEFLT